MGVSRDAPASDSRFKRLFIGAPRDVNDPGVFHKVSLVAFLAWVGLGADGLSSSSYGPEEAFRALHERGDFTFLAIFLALATAVTVLVLSRAYSHVIEHFPAGGGGYVVATKLLGEKAGLISGAALLVDYVLTITVSVASGGDALFSLMPVSWVGLKLPVELVALVALVLLNLRGVKESVTALVPVFLVFVATHLILICGGIGAHVTELPALTQHVATSLQSASATHGWWFVLVLLVGAYSRGGGTYTGIEAVSNGLPIMREPRVHTGKRTMLYMAASLAFTASGILLCYLLFDVRPVEGRTMNAVLAEAFAGDWLLFGLPLGRLFVALTLLSEGALLFVAAQTGFIDGPRVMSNMAIDSWLPRRFASLSDRLTMKDGVLLMGGSAMILLFVFDGRVGALVVLYAINVFLTFSLTTLGMLRHAIATRREDASWLRQGAVQFVALVLCLGILSAMVIEKFSEGAWVTVVITTAVIAACLLVRRHYRAIAEKLRSLNDAFASLPAFGTPGGEPDQEAPTAVLMVGGYGGMGVHSLLSLAQMFEGYFKNVIFVSVGVVDSGSFKGKVELDRLHASAAESARQYVELARKLGWNAASRVSVATDAVDGITRSCLDLAKEYRRCMFFAGKLLWKRESWFQRLLHNETAFQVQRRLQWKGLAMVVLPVRVIDDEAPSPRLPAAVEVPCAR